MSATTVKWFDLADHDAKLERRDVDGAGHYVLSLEVPESRLEPLVPSEPGRSLALDLLNMGWQVERASEGRLRLTNHATMNRKSEIVGALRPFFSEEEVEAAHVSVHNLRQGEQVEGLQVRQLVTEGELRRSIDGVELSDLDRITNSVRRAQQLQAERRQRQTQVPFDGYGRRLFDHLTETVVRERGWGEPEAAFVVQQQMFGALKGGLNTVHAVKLNDLARALTRGVQDEIATGTGYVMGRIASSPEDWEEARQRAEEAEAVGSAKERLAAGLTGPLVRPRDAVLDETGRLTPEVMDRVEVPVPEAEAFGFYKDRLPFMVIRDSSVPTRVLAQNMAAVDAALDVVAEELELPRGALVPRQGTVPLRFSYDAVSGDGRAIGVLQSIGGGSGSDQPDDRAALTMSLSVTKGRSFLHELGHLVDMGNGLSAEERHGILSRSGVLADAKVAVDRLFPEGGRFADYLLREDEIFARSFDAHFVNLSRSRGDVELRSLGGLHTTQGFDVAAPFGDLARSSAFMAELKDALGLRREARHEARQKAEVEAAAAPSAASVSFGIG